MNRQMLKDTKLSIIIPTINEEKYVGSLLYDLVTQTFKNFEVIVVDGKSSDNTLKEVDKFKNKLKIRSIIAAKKGASRQRNLGVKHAKYKHLIFLDADNRLDHKFLNEAIREINIDKYQVASSWITPVSNKLVDKIIFNLYNLFYLGLINKIKPGSGGAFLYIKRKAFEDVKGFDEKIKVGEDFDIIHKLHKKGYKFKIIRKSKVKTSVRRLDREGRLKFVLKMIRFGIYYFTRGSLKDSFEKDYKFGDYN